MTKRLQGELRWKLQGRRYWLQSSSSLAYFSSNLHTGSCVPSKHRASSVLFLLCAIGRWKGRAAVSRRLEESRYTGRLELVFNSVQILATFCSRGKWDSDCLMVDGMVSQLGDQVEKLWRRDAGGTGKYPPASLHVSVLFTENNNKRPPSPPNPTQKPMI